MLSPMAAKHRSMNEGPAQVAGLTPTAAEEAAAAQRLLHESTRTVETCQRVKAAAEAIRQRAMKPIHAGLILGTGMGKVAEQIESPVVIPYRDIPYFPRSTALGHKGQLVCGRLAGASVVAMEGRAHLYEGYTVEEVTLPVRAMSLLGATVLIASNASGGMNPKYASGDIMVLEDHLNLMGNCGRVKRDQAHPEIGGRIPRPLDSTYDRGLIDQAMQVARRENFVAHRGVYAAMSGPNYETRAEYRFLRRIGADVVGMSTVPEATVAAELGLRVLALSTVTNVSTPDDQEVVDPQEVIAAAQSAEPRLRKIVVDILKTLATV